MRPLIVDIVIYPDQIDEIFLASQIGFAPSKEDHVACFELTEMMLPRFARQLWPLSKDIDEWIDAQKRMRRITSRIAPIATTLARTS